MEASKSKDDATKQDVVTAIKLWKVNPELYISQELAKSAIRKNLLYRGLPAEKKVFGSYRFPQFGIFPKEIQLMIWGMCAEEARLVEFHSDGTSDTVVPGMMHACAESRRVGLKIYEKISWYEQRYDKSKLHGITFIRWKTDLMIIKDVGLQLQLLTYPHLSIWDGPSLAQCQNLAILSRDLEFLADTKHWNRARHFKKLETLVVVKLEDVAEDSNVTLSGYSISAAPEINDPDLVDKLKAALIKNCGLVRIVIKEIKGSKNFANQIHEEAWRFNEDLLFAARLQDELDLGLRI